MSGEDIIIEAKLTIVFSPPDKLLNFLGKSSLLILNPLITFSTFASISYPDILMNSVCKFVYLTINFSTFSGVALVIFSSYSVNLSRKAIRSFTPSYKTSLTVIFSSLLSAFCFK